MPSPPVGTVHTEVAAVSDGWTVSRRRRRQASELPEARGSVIRHLAEIGSRACRLLAAVRNRAAISARWRMTRPWPRGECGDRRRYRDSPPDATTVGPPRWRGSTSHQSTTAQNALPHESHNRITVLPHKTAPNCTTVRNCTTAPPHHRTTAPPHKTAPQHQTALPHSLHVGGGGRTLAAATGAFQSSVAAAGSARNPGGVINGNRMIRSIYGW